MKNLTTIILFKHKDKSYRMRVARVHLHPGERDCFEVAGKDMLDQVVWSPVPDGSPDVPSGESMTRRALWYLLEGGIRVFTEDTSTIDLGEV